MSLSYEIVLLRWMLIYPTAAIAKFLFAVFSVGSPFVSNKRGMLFPNDGGRPQQRRGVLFSNDGGSP
jgi:hypothetical protein